MLSLGYAGLEEEQHSKRYLDEAEKLDINHQGITSLKSQKQFILKQSQTI